MIDARAPTKTARTPDDTWGFIGVILRDPNLNVPHPKI
jgi:hypothetical protein